MNQASRWSKRSEKFVFWLETCKGMAASTKHHTQHKQRESPTVKSYKSSLHNAKRWLIKKSHNSATRIWSSSPEEDTWWRNDRHSAGDLGHCSDPGQPHAIASWYRRGKWRKVEAASFQPVPISWKKPASQTSQLTKGIPSGPKPLAWNAPHTTGRTCTHPIWNHACRWRNAEQCKWSNHG